MKDKYDNFEDLVRSEVEQFSSRPSKDFWANLSTRIGTDVGTPDGGGLAPADGVGEVGSGITHWLTQLLNLKTITMITIGSTLLTVGALVFLPAGVNDSTPQNETRSSEPIIVDESIDLTDRNTPLPDPLPSRKKTIIIPVLPEEDTEAIVLPEENPDFLLDFEAEEDPAPLERDKDKKTEEPEPIKGKSLVLKKNHNKSDFDQLLQQLETYGFTVTSSNFSHNDGLITSIKIHLKHPNGLDWRLRARNFDRLEFRVPVDDQGKATDLQYKFNKEEFKRVGLTGQGNISHSY